MKRLVLVLIPLALVVSACAVPVIKPPTYLSDKGAVFNGNVYSNVNGDAEYWWRISSDNGGGGTSNHTVTLVAGQAGAVSTPFTILDPATTYHLTMCAQDHEQNPPRQVCSKPTDFTTPPAGGRSGIAYQGAGGLWIMNADGTNKTLVPGGIAHWPSWSPDATKIAYSGSGGLSTMKADGTNRISLAPNGARPAWSPDGTKIAYIVYGPASENPGVWLMNADGTNKVKLADDTAIEAQATWRPDGEKIAFTKDVSGSIGQIVVMNPDGSNQTPISGTSGDYEAAWSPDGTRILFKHNGDLWTMKSDGSNRTDLSSIFNEDDYGSWSPDGSKIAFVSYRAGHQDLWKMDANGANPTNLTNGISGGADFPVWSPRP